MDWIVVALAFIGGTCFGFAVAALLVMAGDAEPSTITDIESRLRGDS